MYAAASSPSPMATAEMGENREREKKRNSEYVGDVEKELSFVVMLQFPLIID